MASVHALVAVAKIADAIPKPPIPAFLPRTVEGPTDYRIAARTPRELMEWLRRVKQRKGWRTPADTTPPPPPPLPPVLREFESRVAKSPKRNKRKARAK